jgi:hypothetical protein
MTRRTFAGAVTAALAAVGLRRMPAEATTRPATPAVRLSRGVYTCRATGQTAYLGTLVYLVDSNNNQVASYHVLDCQDLTASLARSVKELDRLDPVPRSRRPPIAGVQY